MTATADSERVVLIVNNHPLGYSDSSTIYVTLDKGKIVRLFLSSIYLRKISGETWTRIEVPFELSGSMMKFHPTNADMVLATDMNEGKLWITKDFCKTWSKVHESGKAHAYKWDPRDTSGKVFYYTHDPTGTGIVLASFNRFAVFTNHRTIFDFLIAHRLSFYRRVIYIITLTKNAQ